MIYLLLSPSSQGKSMKIVLCVESVLSLLEHPAIQRAAEPDILIE